jgi:hypothetical protein
VVLGVDVSRANLELGVDAVESRPNMSFRPNMELVAVAPRPNEGFGVDASRPNMEMDTIASRPNMGLGMDASRSNMELGGDACIPNLGLGVDVSRPNVGLDMDTSRSNILLPAKKNHIVDLKYKI